MPSKTKSLDEKYFRRILRTSGTNFVLGNDKGGFYLNNTRHPICIIPGAKISTIEICYTLDKEQNDLEEVITGLINLALVRNALEGKGYGFTSNGMKVNGRDLFYRADVDTPRKKDLEKVVKNCNSL